MHSYFWVLFLCGISKVAYRSEREHSIIKEKSSMMRTKAEPERSCGREKYE